MPDVMGYRGKFGFVLASSNSVAAPDVGPLCPPGASTQYSDFLQPDAPISPDSGWRAGGTALVPAVKAALERMQTRQASSIGALIDQEMLDGVDREEILASLSLADTPIVFPSEALAAAAEKTGWTRNVGLFSPFTAQDNVVARSTLATLGFDVTADVALGHLQAREGAHLSFTVLRQHYVTLMERGVDVVVQLGHNLPLAKLAENLEEDFGIPILPINAVCFWHMLRSAGIDDLVTGSGKLFLDY